MPLLPRHRETGSRATDPSCGTDATQLWQACLTAYAHSYCHLTSKAAEHFEIEKKVDPKLREYMQDLRDVFPERSPRMRNCIRADMSIQNYWEYLEEELVTWIARADRRKVNKYLRDIQTLCALNNLRLRPGQARPWKNWWR